MVVAHLIDFLLANLRQKRTASCIPTRCLAKSAGTSSTVREVQMLDVAARHAGTLSNRRVQALA